MSDRFKAVEIARSLVYHLLDNITGSRGCPADHRRNWQALAVSRTPIDLASRRQFQFGLESGACRQAYQQIHAESVDLSSLQIRHARLRNSQHLGGLGL